MNQSNSNPHDSPSTVIVGAGGRLGSALCRVLGRSERLVPLGRDQLDLGCPESIRASLEPLTYNRLILAGALTAVDFCEANESLAFAVNADGPKLVAEISAEKGAHVTYIGTDFVFGGFSSRPYQESRIPRPLSVYGASKLEGEENVLAVSPANLVVRVAWLYGSGKRAFPEWVIQQALERSELALPEEKIGSPTFSDDVACYLPLLLGGKGGEPGGGVYHLANSGSCTWQEWGQFCLDRAIEAGWPLKTRWISGNRLEDIEAFSAVRPVNSALDCGKFARRTGVRPRSWQAAMTEYLNGILQSERGFSEINRAVS
jgi:dTDP-4-dehydrorhamnose reductase